VAKHGRLRSLHVRFYFDDPLVDWGAADGQKIEYVREQSLRQHVKRLFADVDVYIVKVDAASRNDAKSWEKRYGELLAGKG